MPGFFPVAPELIHQKKTFLKKFFSPSPLHIKKDFNNKSTTVTFFALRLFFIIPLLCG